MNTPTPSTQPWYKHRWPWILIQWTSYRNDRLYRNNLSSFSKTRYCIN
jgi:hypothetical protein